MSPIERNRTGSWTGPAYWAAAGCVGLLVTSPVRAEGPDRLNDRFAVSLGTFIMNSSTTLSVDGEGSQGTQFDWDSTFGDEGDKTRLRLDGYWRFAEHHKVRAMAFNYSRSNSRQFEKEVEFDGEVYPIGAIVKGGIDFAIYELAYEYAFLRRDTWELGASIGVHYTQFESSLSATFDSGGGGGTVSQRGEADFDAPLPVIGLHGMWRLGNDFWLNASAQLFSLSIDEYDGSLQDYRIGVIWQPKPWVGVGLGFNRFSVDVDVDTSNFKGSLDWEYDGPQVYYTVSF